MSEFPTYQIATVDDFRKVPEGKIEACLADFAHAIAAHREAANEAKIVAEHFGIELLDSQISMPHFDWIDDGEVGLKRIDVIFDDTIEDVASLRCEFMGRFRGPGYATKGAKK